MLRESEAGGAWTTAKVYKENWLATRERYCDLCAKRVERCQRRVKVRAHVHEAVQCDLVLGGERAVGRMCIAAAEIGATHFRAQSARSRRTEFRANCSETAANAPSRARGSHAGRHHPFQSSKTVDTFQEKYYDFQRLPVGLVHARYSSS